MQTLLASYPALTVINPNAFEEPLDLQMTEDKGYCRVCPQEITIRAFPRDKYEYIRNFYFIEADGEYFCVPSAAMISSSGTEHKATYGFELGDIITVEGKQFRLLEDWNKNIKMERVV